MNWKDIKKRAWLLLLSYIVVLSTQVYLFIKLFQKYPDLAKIMILFWITNAMLLYLKKLNHDALSDINKKKAEELDKWLGETFPDEEAGEE